VTGMSMRNKALLPGFIIAFVFITILAAAMVAFIKESPMVSGNKPGQ